MKKYIAKDAISKNVLKSAKLLQTIDVNALIVGDKGVGKKSLAKFILPNSKIYQAKDLQNSIFENELHLQNEAIILDKIEELTNINLFLEYIEKSNLRVIALLSKESLNNKLKDSFPITLELVSLKNRKEDFKELAKKFSIQTSKDLNLPELPLNKLHLDISNNAHSLKKSIYFSYLFETVDEKEVLNLLENFFYKKLEEDVSYKQLLELFDVPLLKAANKKYPSQVQVAKNLGINRVTLRKKLELYKGLI